MVVKGQKINDRYQIIKTIGEGGMANVYLAYDTILDRNVALKILRGDLAGDEKFVRRFQREALSSSSLSHPNIVEMYDVGEDNGQYYIVMEYVNGKTLKQLIKKRGTLTLPEVVDIMLQITDGIAHAHDSYIIHRDIKPQNIMILENGLVKITDFGIAMALNAAQLTQTNSVMGSVHYLPPEQATGKGASIKSDIYSIGILMFELITGSIPFKGDNAVEIALKQMKEPLPDVTLYNPEIPQAVENILLKACAKNPKNRYKDARSMYEDLKICLDEDQKEVDRVVYKYPENDLDETKVLEKISDMQNTEVKEEKDNIATKVDVEETKSKKVPWIIGSILAGFILISVAAFFLISNKEEPDIKIPDVKDMTIVDAEDTLIKAGFKVDIETEKIADDEIEEGKVIKTEPAIGRTVKKGKTIKLYESLGSADIEVENYVGKNCEVAKALIEQAGDLVAECVKKNVDDITKYKENIVFEQNPKYVEGSKLPKGAKITLYIPNIDIYPNMIDEPWIEEDVKTFAEKYNLNLTINYVEVDDENVGFVKWQSRRAGTAIVSGTDFKVNITKSKPVKPKDDDIIIEQSNNDSGTN